MKVLIFGANGKMGQEMTKYLEMKDEKVVCVDKHNRELLQSTKVDIIVDFSTANALCENLEYAKNSNTPIVIATTGHTSENMKKIEQASKFIPIFMSSNFSLMFNVLNRLLRNIRLLKDCDFAIEEMHHKQKKDSPSGSAIMLVKTLNNQKISPQVVSLRLGNVVGEHKVHIVGDYENLTFSHSAKNRQVFCQGAYTACKFLLTKKSGLFDMENLIDCM